MELKREREREASLKTAAEKEVALLKERLAEMEAQANARWGGGGVRVSGESGDDVRVRVSLDPRPLGRSDRAGREWRALSLGFGSVWIGLVRFGSVRLGSARLGSTRLGSVRCGSARVVSASLRPLWSGEVQLGVVRLG